jgi:hypothetical protein
MQQDDEDFDDAFPPMSGPTEAVTPPDWIGQSLKEHFTPTETEMLALFESPLSKILPKGPDATG